MSEEAAAVNAAGVRVSAALGRSSSGSIVAPATSPANCAGALLPTDLAMNLAGRAHSARAVFACSGSCAPQLPIAMGELTPICLYAVA